MVVGYRNTKGVIINPILIHSQGKEKSTAVLALIKPAKKSPACLGESSPVVSGLAFVLSTCLSISRSVKSFIIQPADLAVSAPNVNNPTVHGFGMIVVDPSARPQ